MSEQFEWKEEFSVSVEEIDEQHKKLVGLISRLFAVVSQTQGKKETESIIQELIAYTKYHFSTEEKYFKKFNYKYKDEHIKQHQGFVTKVTALKKKCMEDEIAARFELVDFLEDWLIHHVTGADRKYIKCFTENGLK